MRVLHSLFLLALAPAAAAQFGQDTVTYANGWPPTHTCEATAKLHEGSLRTQELPYTAYLRLHNDTLFQLGTIAYFDPGLDGHTGRWEAHGDTLLLHCTAQAHGAFLKARRTGPHALRAVRAPDGTVTVLDPQWEHLRLAPHPVEPRSGKP